MNNDIITRTLLLKIVVNVIAYNGDFYRRFIEPGVEFDDLAHVWWTRGLYQVMVASNRSGLT